jgi:IS30 family transposase
LRDKKEASHSRRTVSDYFPKGTDLSFRGPGILEDVVAELNHRPRKRHGYLTPAEVLATLISNPSNQTGVADTV